MRVVRAPSSHAAAQRRFASRERVPRARPCRPPGRTWSFLPVGSTTTTAAEDQLGCSKFR
jgi:hypothetical protein